jgi:uncharacterized membrane protein SirB2
MSIQTFSQWLYATPVAESFRETVWIIPTVQTIHILAIAILVGVALVSNLRLAGILATDETPTAVVRRYLPWMGPTLIVLLGTGLLLVVAEPGRTLSNTVFWTKMLLILSGFALTRGLQKPLLTAPPSDSRAAVAKPVAWLSLAVWGVVIFCGRFIAYT